MMPTKYLLLLLLFVIVYELVYFNSKASKVQAQSQKLFLQNMNSQGRTNGTAFTTSNDVREEDLSKSDEKMDFSSEEEIEMYFKTNQVAIKAIEQDFDKELNFIVIGDYGYTDKDKPNLEQKKLGEFIADRVTRSFLNYDFMLSVGDNFYPLGLESLEDKKSTTIFEETFQMSRLGLDWYSILGNHDLIGNMSAALRLSELFPLWKQTEPYYSKIFPIGNSNLKAGFIFLHSGDLVCRDRNNFECYKNIQKSIRFDQIQTQVDWFGETLANMSEDPEIVWKIVLVHNAVFSAGIKHGDNADLKELILPHLLKYKVDLVLSGHDHSVQYLRMNMNSEESNHKNEELVQDDSNETFLQDNQKEDMKEESESECDDDINEDYCSIDEFFHFELTKCGIVKKSEQPKYLESVYYNSNKKLFNIMGTKYSRESTSMQHEFLHQFVMGNGGIKHEEVCPVKQMKSAGKLRYAHTVSGVGDIKIREDRIDVNLLSVDNELLYSVKIFRNINEDQD